MKNVSNSGRDAYMIIFDDLLRISTATMRKRVNLYSIIYEKLHLNDSFLFTNDRLQKLLLAPDGGLLLESGIIVPLRRDTHDSFKSMIKKAKADFSKYCATDEFIDFLDQKSHPKPYSKSQVEDNYVAMDERILKHDVLTSFGISKDSIAIIDQILGQAQRNGSRKITNSFVYDLVKPLLPQSDGDKLLDLVRAPYNLNLPSMLKTGIVGPEGFKGDQILAALRGKTKKTASLGITEAEQDMQSLYRKKINDPLVNWLLSKEILESLSTEDLLTIRSASSREDYLQRLSSFLLLPTALNWELLTQKLVEYLHSAGNELFRQRARKNLIKADPAEAESVLEGSSALRIIGGQPVELRGLDSEQEPDLSRLEIQPMQVIGNTFNLPDHGYSMSDNASEKMSQSPDRGNDGHSTATATDHENKKRKKGQKYPAIYATF